jgi:hypothetical protein
MLMEHRIAGARSRLPDYKDKRCIGDAGDRITLLAGHWVSIVLSHAQAQHRIRRFLETVIFHSRRRGFSGLQFLTQSRERATYVRFHRAQRQIRITGRRSRPSIAGYARGLF